MTRKKTPSRVYFGNKMRELRRKLNLSQQAFSDLCGLHVNYIGSVERGERNISLENIVVLTNALQCCPSYLIMNEAIEEKRLTNLEMQMEILHNTIKEILNDNKD